MYSYAMGRTLSWALVWAVSGPGPRDGKRASPARMWPGKKRPGTGWPVKQKQANSHNPSRIGWANGPSQVGPSSFFNLFFIILFFFN